MKIVDLYRYPVKGLSPERLSGATLARGDYFPGDRVYAIENGPCGFDRLSPRHQAKIKFLMLMRDEDLARLRTRYDDDSTTLIIESEGREAVRADLSTAEGRLAVEAFMRRFVPRQLRGPPNVLAAPPGFRFTDSRSGFASIINLASVQAIADWLGTPVDPLRFRGNIHVEELAAFEEFDLVGRVLEGPHGVRLKVSKRIERCAAINVDPTSGQRDLDIPATLIRRLGHRDCGIYVEVLSGGRLSEADTLAPRPDLLDPDLLDAAPSPDH